MAKFFRKNRKEGMTQNKTGSYIKYAIGEIVLVVIGILIAVSINNWSETNKQNQELQNIYANVLEDLNMDVNHIETIIKGYKDRDSLFNRIMDGKMTKLDYENCTMCTKIITGYPDLKINKGGYDLLSKYNNNSKSGSDSLQIKTMQFYTEQFVDLHANDGIMSDDLKSNYVDWKNKHTWYADYLNNRDLNGFIDYALNDPDYKNRVSSFYFLHYKVYLPILEKFNNKAKVLANNIKEEIGE
jgi:hypothetical protein|nr:DUF6090 family protein [uncultured Psychroserpens sp.]